MDKQKTIAREISFSGKGLHTGNFSNVALKPAPPDSGVRFIRTDKGNTVIPAHFSHVIGVLRGTTIGVEDVSVCTIEHLMSALHCLGVDNIDIEMDNNEVPIFDGSANFFVNYLLDADIVEQDRPKKIITLSEPVIYKQEGSEGFIEIVAYPADALSVDCTIRYDHPLIREQRLSLAITPETYKKEIAPAKTFCFDYEIEAIKKSGLAKGGGIENVIIIGIDRIHNDDKMKYRDEFVRHKILDILGDIYLMGKSLRANIVAFKCGHRHNINFAKKIAEESEKANGKERI